MRHYHCLSQVQQPFTLTLDRDHGLAVGALIAVYGIRDQAAAAP